MERNLSSRKDRPRNQSAPLLQPTVICPISSTQQNPSLSFLSFTSYYLICLLHAETSLLLKCFSCLPFLFSFHCHPSPASPCQLMPDLIQHLPRRCPCLQGLPTPIHSAQLPRSSSLGNAFVTSSPNLGPSASLVPSCFPPTNPIPRSSAQSPPLQTSLLASQALNLIFFHKCLPIVPWSEIAYPFLSANSWPWLLFKFISKQHLRICVLLLSH